MHLTLHTDYALRTLIFLAVLPDRLGTVHEVATAYAISENHLTKVVHRLGLLGYIETVRGRRGGMRLARASNEINIGAVVRDIEDDFALSECAGGGSCCLKDECLMRNALDQALGAFMAVLDSYSLADLTANKRNLVQRLLSLEAVL